MDALGSQPIHEMSAVIVGQAEEERKTLVAQRDAADAAEKRNWEPKSLALAVTVAAIMIIVGAVLLGNVMQNVPLEARTMQFIIRQPGFIVMACSPCAVVVALVGKACIDRNLPRPNMERIIDLNWIVRYKDAKLLQSFNQFIKQHKFVIQPAKLGAVCIQYYHYKQHLDKIAELEPQSIAARDEWCKRRQEDIKEATDKEIDAELAAGRKWLNLNKKVVEEKKDLDNLMRVMTEFCGVLEGSKSQT